MSLTTRRFSKYDETGAYHWKECDPRSRTYNPPLVARYTSVTRRIPPGLRILDLGCGDGYLMHLLSPQAATVTGIDPEPTAVQLASRMLHEHANCSVSGGSCYDLPFADGAFDVVVMADVIEHLTDDSACLREAARVLAPGGQVIITTPRRRPDRPQDPNHVREYSAAELRTRCEETFEDVRMTCLWPVRWSRLYRTKIGWRVLREVGRYVWNPFLREGNDPEKFAQLLAVCRLPRQSSNERHGPCGTTGRELTPEIT